MRTIIQITLTAFLALSSSVACAGETACSALADGDLTTDNFVKCWRELTKENP